MEITILEDKKNRFVFELQGVDHTFCNILKDNLREVKDVSIAAYNISHPLVGIPKFIVETKASLAPKAAIKTALKNMKASDKKLATLFKKLK
ncbi:MAG: DNA-directed RNA polymerase subunit L [Candidatus Cloacimonetes bacterium]|nr:DNA-directed RNA polymerase subunit L [Candidatus Cloacimonadota bacterium]